MEEKKLTDEEIVKVMKCCAESCLRCDECPLREDSWCSNKVLPMGIDLINRQKAEIERLTIAEKQYFSEIERLNKSCGIYQIKLEEQIKETYDYVHKAYKLEKRNAELQKQVDELKANQVIECHGMLKGCDMVKQAVKDTAKEILQGLVEKAYLNGCIDLTVNEVKAWFREDYGVEVE